MLTVRARLQRVGREMKMLVENTDDQIEAIQMLQSSLELTTSGALMQKSGLTCMLLPARSTSRRLRLSPLRLSSLAPISSLR